MAVVYSLRFFRVYVLGLQIKVVTDCNALRTTFSKKDLLPRVGRWWLEVQEYTFDIEYRPGPKMSHVDALSRNPVGIVEVNQIDITEGEWILAAQAQDDDIARIRQILQENTRNNETKQYFMEYVLKDGRVCRKIENNRSVWVVPKMARMQICRLCHDDSGHFGVEKTLEKIKSNYWFAGMRRFVKKYVDACLNCMYYKNNATKKQGKLHSIEKVPVPFHTIHLDHVGPFETSPRKNKYLLVIVDAFTKFTIIEPVRDTQTRSVVKILMNVLYLFGVPHRLVSDRGTAFTSQTFKTFCTTYGIKHVLNAVATPRANGQCERYNKTIVSALATTAAGQPEGDWDLFVKKIQSALNSTYNKAIKTTPVESLIGHRPRSAADSVVLSAIQNNDELQRVDIQTLRSKISKHVSDDQRRQEERYNKKRREAVRFQEGDVVMVQVTSEAATGSSRKLRPKYKGPFQVVKVLINDRYLVQDLREQYKRSKTVMASEKLKRWEGVLQN